MESYPFDDVTPEPAVAPVDPRRAVSKIPSRTRRIAIGAAIGVVVLATGGVAMAATRTGSTTAQGGPGGGRFGGPGGGSESGITGRGGPGGRFGGPGGPGAGGGIANALHGTFVVPAASGAGTTKQDLQTGKVTAVNATSIAVTSTDKVAGSFVLTTTTVVNRGQSKITDIKVGDTVTVIATDTDKKAVSIEDRSLWPAPGGAGGFRGGMGNRVRPTGTPPSGVPTS